MPMPLAMTPRSSAMVMIEEEEMHEEMIQLVMESS